MRKALLLVLLFALPLAAAPANYSGSWSLDKTQSKDLPPFYEYVKTHALTIAQKDGHLLVGVDMTSDVHGPDHFDFDYTLDGKLVKTETKIRTQNGPTSVPSTLQATPESNGDLTIVITRELPMREGEIMKGTMTEKWHLQPDGKTLVIDRLDDMRGRMSNSTLVFTRTAP